MTNTLQKTPLYDSHVKLGGRLVDFAGFLLPVQYQGVIAETEAVRQDAGMFDVSHMGRLQFEGPRVVEYLELVTSNDVSKLADHTGQYSLLPNKSGGCVDDIIVYRLDDHCFRMVVNGANHAKDWNWLNQENTYDLRIEDHTDHTAMIAVQGPGAVGKLQQIASEPEALSAAPMFGVVHSTIGGVPCFCARSGYTGEDGYELICGAEHATDLWDALLAVGVVACGLGSRDVLRVEAGLPLYGHELTDELSPIAAGLGWVIGKEKAFNSSDSIRQDKLNGTPTRLVGLRLDSKRVPQIGMPVLVDGVEVGAVSSGVYSPTLGSGIAFAFVKSEVELNTPCALDFRGKLETGNIVGKRFFKREKPT